MTDVLTDRLQESTAKISLTFDRSIFILLVVFFLCSAFSIALTQIGYFSALTIWVGKMIYSRQFPWLRTPLDLFFLGYVAAEVLATLFAYNKAQSLLYLQRRLLLIPIVYVLVANLTSTKQLKISVSAILLSAMGVALWSFGDLFTHLSEYLRFQRRLAEFQIYMTGGGIMMIAMLLLLPFVVHEETPVKIRSLALVSVIPLAANLLFTFTRSSWLGFIVGAIVIGVRRNKKLLVPLGVLVLAVFLFASPDIKERIYSMVDPYHPNNVTRLHMWETGLSMFLDHP
ncbi:MAG: O-antigen ligase family protein, partial [Ignavibacteria bacterium]|nr:O-antigen ligase family protein [Ignavibacteria bacterium]